MTQYRCIMFDLDDTLWACKPVIQKAEERFYAWLQAHHEVLPNELTAQALTKNRMAFMQQHPQWHHDLTYLRKRWMEVLADQYGLDDSFVEDGFEVYWLARNEVQLYEGVAEFLTRLKTHYVIGSVTNGNADVAHIGLDHLFDFSVTSIEAGVAKPHQDIFHLAAEKAGHELAKILHVGDDWERDVQGAIAAGASAAWVLTEGASKPASVRHARAPVFEVNSVLELDAELLPLSS